MDMENIIKMIILFIGGCCAVFGLIVILLASYAKLFLIDLENKDDLTKFEQTLLDIFG